MSSATSNTSTTSSLSIGTITGIVLGSIAALLIIIYFIRKRRSGGVNMTPTTNTPVNAGNMAVPRAGNNGMGIYAR